jgi:hypothetical protein
MGTALCLLSRLQLYPKQSEEKRLLDAMLLAVPEVTSLQKRGRRRDRHTLQFEGHISIA